MCDASLSMQDLSLRHVILLSLLPLDKGFWWYGFYHLCVPFCHSNTILIYVLHTPLYKNTLQHCIHNLVPQYTPLELHRNRHNHLGKLIWARAMIIHREIGSSCHHKPKSRGWTTPLSWSRAIRRCWWRIKGGWRRFMRRFPLQYFIDGELQTLYFVVFYPHLCTSQDHDWGPFLVLGQYK
jgi:hypothetical protein